MGAHIWTRKAVMALGTAQKNWRCALPEKLTFGIIWAWAWILSKMRHDEETGAYHEAPVMSPNE
jgi:hypothetical protein